MKVLIISANFLPASPRPKRIAVLCKSDGWNEARFWETVAVNRGVPVHVLREHDSAENWLLG